MLEIMTIEKLSLTFTLYLTTHKKRINRLTQMSYYVIIVSHPADALVLVLYYVSVLMLLPTVMHRIFVLLELKLVALLIVM
jgi:hypothetical protein